MRLSGPGRGMRSDEIFRKHLFWGVLSCTAREHTNGAGREPGRRARAIWVRGEAARGDCSGGRASWPQNLYLAQASSVRAPGCWLLARPRPAQGIVWLLREEHWVERREARPCL